MNGTHNTTAGSLPPCEQLIVVGHILVSFGALFVSVGGILRGIDRLPDVISFQEPVSGLDVPPYSCG